MYLQSSSLYIVPATEIPCKRKNARINVHAITNEIQWNSEVFKFSGWLFITLFQCHVFRTRCQATWAFHHVAYKQCFFHSSEARKPKIKVLWYLLFIECLLAGSS